jgi:hypothetical protein
MSDRTLEIWGDGEKYVLYDEEIDELWHRTANGDDRWQVLKDILKARSGGDSGAD